jgi:transposase InsO family protein
MRTHRPCPAPARSAFAGFRFPSDVIVLAVRWYLRFGLSYRDVEELLTERGVEVDHVTVDRWVRRFMPLLADAARPCRHAVGDRWQVDETYVKVAGHWRYVYRAIDQFGQVIDVFVSARRDAKAARRFFDQAISATKVTLVRHELISEGCHGAQSCQTDPKGAKRRLSDRSQMARVPARRLPGVKSAQRRTTGNQPIPASMPVGAETRL